MRYFFISGCIGIKAFDFSVTSKMGYPRRDEIVQYVKERINATGTIIITNVTEMNAEDYNNWNLPLTQTATTWNK